MATVRCRSAAKGAATQTYDGSGNAVTGYVYDLADNRIETHRPEGGIWKQSFDARNQVSSESGPIALQAKRIGEGGNGVPIVTLERRLELLAENDFRGDQIPHATRISGEEPDADLVHVYRGTKFDTAERIREETGYILSDEATRAYVENGNLDEALRMSDEVHQRWIEVWGGENHYIEAHSAFGTELPQTFGLRKTFISVTTDPKVAAYYAKGGRVYEGWIPRSSLLKQTLQGAGESEFLLRNGTNLLKPVP